MMVRFVYAAGYKIEMKASAMASGSAHRGRCRHGHHRQCINCMGVALVMQSTSTTAQKNTCTCNFHVRLFIKHDRIKCIYWCGFNAVSIRWNRINSWIDSFERMNNLCALLLLLPSYLVLFHLELNCIAIISTVVGWWHVDEIDWNMWHNVINSTDTEASKFASSISYPYIVKEVYTSVCAKRVRTKGHVYIEYMCVMCARANLKITLCDANNR